MTRRPSPRSGGSGASGAACAAAARPGRRPWRRGRWRWSSSRSTLQRGHGALDLLPRVVARAHERPRLHVAVAHREADPFELGELGGRVVARDREVPRGGTQILAEGEDVDPLGAEVLYRAEELVPLLTQP